jgi:DnaJ-domain-containing protein 1
MQNRHSERRGANRTKSRAPEALRIALGDRHPRKWLDATLIDSCNSGLGISLVAPLSVGAPVVVRLRTGNGSAHAERRAKVAWCLGRTDGTYRAGLQYDIPCDERTSARARQSAATSERAGGQSVDHYEVLMVSPNADPDTIHRVYRMLAQRYHPDNPDSGNEDAFKELLDSYRVLSDPEQRAAFDAQRLARQQQRFRLLAEPEGDGTAGSEKHKRQIILSLLYRQRLREPDHPYLTIRDLEDLLGYPRDHLQVSLWFLKEKQFLTRSDNGRYSITADGFEHAESQGWTQFSERKMLTAS